MEVEAVLETLVAETDDGGAGVVGAALSFENGEDVRVESLGVITLRLLFREAGLPDFVFQELFLDRPAPSVAPPRVPASRVGSCRARAVVGERLVHAPFKPRVAEIREPAGGNFPFRPAGSLRPCAGRAEREIIDGRLETAAAEEQ